jgi:MFS transporter, CP family, cyanate transporter
VTVETSVRHRRPILLIAGILVVAANLRPALTGVGPLLDDIRADLGLSGSAAGLLTALPLLMFAVFSPVSSAVALRIGTERALWGGLVGLAAGILLRSAPVTGAIWVGTAIVGASIAFFNVLLPSVVKRDFPRHLGLLIGIYSAVQSVVAALASGIAVPIAGHSASGWRWSMAVWAALAVVAVVVWSPQLRRPSTRALPSAVKVRTPWHSALAWQVTSFMGLQSLVFYATIAWLPSIEKSAGTSATAAGWLLFLFQIVSVISSLGSSALIQRLPDQRLLGLAAAASSVIGVIGLLVATSWSPLWMVLMGLGTGASIVIALSLFGLRTADHTQAAALSGMAQLVGYLVAAAGPVAAGALHDATDSWTPPLLLIAAFIVVQGCVIAYAGRNRLVSWARPDGLPSDQRP